MSVIAFHEKAAWDGRGPERGVKINGHHRLGRPLFQRVDKVESRSESWSALAGCPTLRERLGLQHLGGRPQGVFLQERTSLPDGSHVEPVLEKGGAAHDAFLKQYLDKNDSALQTYYRSLVFTGKGSMPKAVGTDGDVVAYVRRPKARARKLS